MSLEVLNLARRNLSDALGEKSTNYFNVLNQWFRMKITLKEFDVEARKIISQDQAGLHNEFLLALLNKVDGLGDSSITAVISCNRNIRKHRRASRTSDKSNFDPVDLPEYFPPSSAPGASSDNDKCSNQEMFLPIHELIMGRFMSAAWEFGLEGASDDAAGIIFVAVQNFLKNVISAIITQRKGYKMWNRQYMHDIGSGMPNMWLHDTSKLSDTLALPPRCTPAQQLAALKSVYSTPNPEPNNDKLTIDECYNTLLTHKNIIACHSVYAVNMERLAGMLNHRVPNDGIQ